MPVALLLCVACTGPVVTPPPLEMPAPVLDTPLLLEAREGDVFSHLIEVTSPAPPVALALLAAPAGLTINGEGRLTWTPDFEQAGEYVVTVVATDAQPSPRSTRVELTIIVANTNRNPAAPVPMTDATFPVFAGTSFVVSASADDPDGDDLTFDWSVSDDDWTIIPDGESVTVTASQVRGASAVLTVVVSDGFATATATLPLSTQANRVPGSPAITTEASFPIFAGTSFLVSASADDPDGDALTYAWSVSDDGWTIIQDGDSVTVTASQVRDASAALTVVVSDGFESASTTLLLSTQANRAPGSPAIATEASFPIFAGTSFVVSASADDPDGDALIFDWSVSDDDWTLLADGASVAVTSSQVRDASAVLTVVVSDGFETASTTLLLSTQANRAPSLPVLETEAAFPLRSGEAATFTASATDPDADALTYAWAVEDELWSLDAADATARVTPQARGSTTTLTVTASDGALTTSTTYQLTSAANLEPQVILQPAAPTLLATTMLSLAAQGSDADDDVLSYSWQVEGEGWALSADGATATVTAPGVVGAEAIVTVTVTDGWGGEASATHTLTTTGVRLRGTVDFLQTGTLRLEAPGGEQITVSENGAFVFPATRLSPDATWTLGFESQPTGQRCQVSGGNGGTVDVVDVEVAVVCTIIERRASPPYFPAETTSTSYVPMPFIDPISFELSKPAHALVTLSVAHLAGEGLEDAPGKAWVGVSVDGVVVEEAIWEDARFPVGGPVGFVTTVPLAAGTHVIEPVWKVGDVGVSATLTGVMGGAATVTTSIIESLPWGLGGLRVTGSLEGTTPTDSPTLPLSLPFDAPATALLSAQVPEVGAHRYVGFDLKYGPTTLAQASLDIPDTAHAIPLVALSPVNAEEALTVDWVATEGASLGGAPVSLSAALFDPGVQKLSVSASDMIYLSSVDYETVLSLGSSALSLTGKRRVLIVFQAKSAYMASHSTGDYELAIMVNGAPTTYARLRGEIFQPQAPVQLATIVELNAGAHTISVAGHGVSAGKSMIMHAGLRSLTAIVLD